MEIVERVLKEIKLPFELREKQVEVINKYGLFSRHGLYLDMGVGKTVCSTIIGVDRLLSGAFMVLVLAPPSIIPQWKRWLESLNLSVLVYAGSIAERKEILKKGVDFDFCVMSPNIFRNDFLGIRETLKGKEIHLIIDEANIIKRAGKTFTKVRLLQGNEGGITLLTGTPLTSPQDAYGYIKIITPWLYSTPKQFERVHIAVKDEYGSAVEYDNLELLKENFFKQSVRVEVDEVLDMPDIDYQFVNYQLTPKHLELYRRLIKQKVILIEKTGEILDATKKQAMWHWAQRLVFSPEHMGYEGEVAGIDLTLAQIEDVETIVVFATYVETNEKLCRLIKGAEGVYGSISRQRKDQNILDFQQGKIHRMVVNPDSGGIGTELQDHCNHVLFSEFPVTGNKFRQARSRVWRQGQKKKVICRMLVAEGTVQATLIRNIMRKDDVLAQVQPTKLTLRQELLGEE
jgi:SNF2 family DNA or RNA helicase